MLQDFIRVGRTDELSPGQMKLVEIGEERILLTNVDGEYHAVSEVCTHVGGPLSEGRWKGRWWNARSTAASLMFGLGQWRTLLPQIP
jgi:nitrite reductase/ring-hydroxylating ferredoxin subunit